MRRISSTLIERYHLQFVAVEDFFTIGTAVVILDQIGLRGVGGGRVNWNNI